MSSGSTLKTHPIYKSVIKVHIFQTFYSFPFGTTISIYYWANYTQGKTKPHRKAEDARLCAECFVWCRLAARWSVYRSIQYKTKEIMSFSYAQRALCVLESDNNFMICRNSDRCSQLYTVSQKSGPLLFLW